MTTGFASTVAAFGEKVKNLQLEVFKAALIEAGERVIDETPKKTGRTAGSWETAIGAPAPGPAPKRDPDAAKAELRGMVENLKLGDVAFFTSSYFNARLVEYGTGRQPAQGTVRLTAQDWDRIVAEAVAKVRGR